MAKISKSMIIKPLNLACECATMADAMKRNKGQSGTGMKSMLAKLKKVLKKAGVKIIDLSTEHKNVLEAGLKAIEKGETSPTKVLNAMAPVVSDIFAKKMRGEGYTMGSGFSTDVGVELGQSGGDFLQDLLGAASFMPGVPPGLQAITMPLSMARNVLGFSGDGVKRAGEGCCGGSVRRAGEGVKRAGEGVHRAGEGVRRAGEGTHVAGGSIFGKIAGFMLGGPAGVAATTALGLGMHGEGLHGGLDFGALLKKVTPALAKIMKLLFSPKNEKERQESAKPAYSACRSRLSSVGITDMKSWRRWTLKNHPDKGGNAEQFAKVSNCVDELLKNKTVTEGTGALDKIEKALNKATKFARMGRTGVQTANKFGINTGKAGEYVDKFGNALDTVRSGLETGKRVRKTIKDVTGRGAEQDGGFLGLDWLPKPSTVTGALSPLLAMTPLAGGVVPGNAILHMMGIGDEGSKGGSTHQAGTGKRSNPWILHLKSYRASHPGVSYKDAMKQAKLTYKKK